MVSLARGLMDDAKLLLIDEPSLGLAPKISKGLIEALMQIDIKDGAMVIAEQNLSLLEGKVIAADRPACRQAQGRRAWRPTAARDTARATTLQHRAATGERMRHGSRTIWR